MLAIPFTDMVNHGGHQWLQQSRGKAVAVLVRGTSIYEAWLAAVRVLRVAPHRELFDLLAEVADPSIRDTDALDQVDVFLDSLGHQRLDGVARTIFPARLADRSATREQLYARYERMLPRIKRRDTRNRRGTYFSRLITYPLADPSRANQIERVIHDLGVNPDRRMRHIYEMQVFAPGKDVRPEGFPCLSSLSAHVEDGRLRMAATYRNQYYVERGLGNFLGLAALQTFIASESGLPIGPLSVHAFHAELDGRVRDVDRLLGEIDQADGGIP